MGRPNLGHCFRVLTRCRSSRYPFEHKRHGWHGLTGTRRLMAGHLLISWCLRLFEVFKGNGTFHCHRVITVPIPIHDPGRRFLNRRFLNRTCAYLLIRFLTLSRNTQSVKFLPFLFSAAKQRQAINVPSLAFHDIAFRAMFHFAIVSILLVAGTGF